jgi:hypothetical protein
LISLDKYFICGLKLFLQSSSIGLCICSFLIGLSYYLQNHGDFQEFCSPILIVGLVGYVLSFGIGLGGLPWVIMSEVFPVNVKITAGSLVTVSNWFFSWIIIFSFNFMMQWSAFGKFLSINLTFLFLQNITHLTQKCFISTVFNNYYNKMKINK